MKLRPFLAATLLVATASLSASAQSAQPWIKDRRFSEGIGYRTGNLELHPGVGAELGYDSNYFMLADDEGAKIDVIRLRVTPSLSLSTLGAQRRGEGGGGAPPSMNFRAGVFANYNKLFATDSKNDEAVSKNDNAVNVGAGFNLDVLPQRPWGFDMYGDFVRSAEPSNAILEELAFSRDTLRLGAGVNWRPGGGLFEWRLGYELDYSFFERDAYKNLNNSQHYVNMRGRWRFLPRTAALYDGKLGFLRYGSAQNVDHNAQTVESKIGVNGLVTNHFTLLAMAGWAASFYEPRGPVPANNYDGPVGQAELKWFLLPQPTLAPDQATVGLSSIALGYVRNYANSYLSDFYRRDRGYANFSYFIAGAFLVSVEGGYSYLTHSPSYFNTGQVRNGSFTQNRVDATFFGEYRPSDVIGINTTLRYSAALDNDRIPLDPTYTLFDNLQYKRYEAWLGVRWFM
jgi:hypothetical protein